MSASVEKQTRRDIRRAMGPEALDLVGEQAKAIRGLQVRMEFVEQAETTLLRSMKEDIEALKGAHVNNLRRWQRGFWGRLRWLVRGR